MQKLILRTISLVLLSIFFSIIICISLHLWGLKNLIIYGCIAFGFVLVWISCWINDKGKLDTSKIIIFILIYIGAIMAGFSYYLAYIQREEIAESLSKAAIVELVAPSVMMLLKSLIENLSINNSWPDKEHKKNKEDNIPQI